MYLEQKTATYPQYAKRWLSPDDLEQVYGFSKSTQAKMRMFSNSSTIPFSKIGGKYIKYDRCAIDAWIESHQVRGAF
jgi:predicted DNA-binding transcriptional regulator AlpA